MIKSSNPVLNDKYFSSASISEEPMTFQGVVNKTGIMFVLLLMSAIYTWGQFFAGKSIDLYMMGGLILGVILAILTIFKKEWAPITGPLYAFAQGFFLGGLSSVFEKVYPGIVIQATILTFGVLATLLFAYTSKLIKATENFKLIVSAATGGICLVYVVGFILSFFGSGIPYIHESGPIGIGFSLFVVVIAALNLVMDFDFIEKGVRNRAPKSLEWFSAFGLVITLVWLYIEILHLLAKLQRR